LQYVFEKHINGDLNIEFVDAGEGFLVAKMPVNASVHQPMGLLHGGLQ
jgi:acyl-coenzyme A thioesterase PaaI-like protein